MYRESHSKDIPLKNVGKCQVELGKNKRVSFIIFAEQLCGCGYVKEMSDFVTLILIIPDEASGISIHLKPTNLIYVNFTTGKAYSLIL